MNTQISERQDPQTGEILTDAPQGATGVAVQIKTEIEAQIDRARRFPRMPSRVQESVHSLVMLDEDTAGECVYALPRGGKPIKGPSVRFAEIVASQYGNCHVGSRVVAVDRFEKVVVAEGVFIDYETGLRVTEQTQRRIADSRGRLYSDDMIVVTGNAARSIAMRNAVLKGVPKPIWRKAYQAAEGVIAGDVKTLAVRRGDAIKAFAAFGVTPEQIFAALEVEGTDDLGLDEIGTLTAMFRAIKSGEQQVEDFFPAKSDPKEAKEAATGTAAKMRQIAEEGAGKEAQKERDHKTAEANREDDSARQDEQERRDSILADARAGGIKARRNGRPRATCPKNVPDPERDAWRAGWDEADEIMNEGGTFDDDA